MDGDQFEPDGEEERQPGLGSAVVGAVAATLALLAYFFARSALSGMEPGYRAGTGMAAAFAAVAELVMWPCLAVFMAAALWRSGLPRGTGWIAVLLLPLAATASLGALSVMQHAADNGEPAGIAHLASALLPWSILLLGLWLRGSRPLHLRLRLRVALVPLAAALILSIGTFIEVSRTGVRIF